jgi:hypothetical protein
MWKIVDWGARSVREMKPIVKYFFLVDVLFLFPAA